MSDTEDHMDRAALDEPPPFLGAWSHVYVFVICYLAFLIALFFLFAWTFNS